MSSLKDMLRSAERGEELFVTPHHAEWLEIPEVERVYTPEAVEEVAKALRGEFKHPRTGRYSASSLGMCHRRVMFGYLGAPQQGVTMDSSDLMAMGTKHHIFWQLEGLSAGYMQAIEVWAHSPVMFTGGSMDALLVDDSVFELKTVRDSVYNRIVVRNREPKFDHTLQAGFYGLALDLKWASIVYEDRNSGLSHEFRVRIDNELLEKVHAETELLNSYRSRGALPQVLDDCEQRKGYVYSECPYRKHCMAQPDVAPLATQQRIRPVMVDLAPPSALRLGE